MANLDGLARPCDRDDALSTIFDALAQRLGGVARGASVVRDGLEILALRDATSAPDDEWIAGLALDARGCRDGSLRAAIVAHDPAVRTLGSLREARAAIDHWSSAAHCTLSHLTRRTLLTFPLAAIVRAGNPSAALEALFEGGVDIASVDLATLASHGAGARVIAIGPALPGRVWCGDRSLRTTIDSAFDDRRLAAARSALRWLQIVDVPDFARARAAREAARVHPPPPPYLRARASASIADGCRPS